MQQDPMTVELAVPEQKHPLSEARRVAEHVLHWLAPHCLMGYCTVAGSVRRRKPQVGDVEILFVPRVELLPAPGEMFGAATDLAAAAINELRAGGVLQPRMNSLGRATWGELIKLAWHMPSGMPVDFFTASKENWPNYLVCRTGPAASNLAIANAARRRGWKWEPYSSGFVRVDDEHTRHGVHSEREVFEFVNLKYLEPEQR